MNTPRISIITPSYNQAAYLEMTLRSVLEQGYPNLEYFVVDGASTDGSVDIIRAYADRLTGWVSEKDSGQAEAINKGLARATGEIVAWLNSDDLYLPGALRAAADAFARWPDAALVFSDVLSIDGDGRVINVMRYGDWGLDELMSFNIIGQPGVFMRRDALMRAGLLDPQYHFLLDHHLWLRVAQQGAMRHEPGPWAAARFHAEAKNVAAAAQFGRDAYRIVDWMQAQAALQPALQRLGGRVTAGAARIDARYLLDGGQPAAALRAYFKSLRAHAPTALAEGHRMIYALLSLLGLGRLKSLYLRLRRARRAQRDPQTYEHFSQPEK